MTEHQAEVTKIIVTMAAAYPQFAITAETIKVYVDRLAKYPPAILREAVRRCIDECKFFPTVAEVKTAAVKLYAVENSMTEGWARAFLEHTGWLALADAKRLGLPMPETEIEDADPEHSPVA